MKIRHNLFLTWIALPLYVAVSLLLLHFGHPKYAATLAIFCLFINVFTTFAVFEIEYASFCTRFSHVTRRFFWHLSKDMEPEEDMLFLMARTKKGEIHTYANGAVDVEEVTTKK